MIIPLTAMHHGDTVDDYCRLLPCYAQSSNKMGRGMMAMKDRKKEALDLEKIRWPCLHPQTFLRPLATRLIVKMAIMRRMSLSVICLMNPLCSQLSFERHKDDACQDKP